MPFAAGLDGTGGSPYDGPECNGYLMSVSSGTLPPGLQLGEPVCEWVISGTPTKTGTYSFIVQITPQPDGFGNPRGPAGFEQFSITIGAGSADRLLVSGASYSPTKYILHIGGYDVNNGATYSVHTSAGALLATLTENAPDNGGDGNFGLNQHRTNAAFISPLTVTDSLGSSVTVPIVFDKPYLARPGSLVGIESGGPAALAGLPRNQVPVANPTAGNADRRSGCLIATHTPALRAV